MLIQVWEGDGITCAPKPSCDKMRESGYGICKKAKLLRQFEAKTWLEAMQKHHEYMGWEPYNPPKLANGEIDPVVLQPLDDM